jgi:hypothetical protein
MRNTSSFGSRSFNSRRRTINGGMVGIIVLIAVIVILGFSCSVMGAKNDTVISNAKVESKERVCSSSSDSGQTCKYLVFTDKGTFEVTDSLLNGRFNSSDVYGRLHEGSTYNLKVVGFRIPIFSSYQNILEATEVER